MRLAVLVAVAAFVSGNAAAQVADRLSRGMEPNAIARSLSSGGAMRSQSQSASPAEVDRLRAEQAARDAAARRAPPTTSTLIDGPAGVQRLGSGAAPAPSASPPTIVSQPR
ncbi:hypothetical protein LQ954_15185 [Sphingomonas sp. IC-11]|uniref:hypothetical protein n=1 Tax=Sphingomonas sp. IC-11 TaxID=2898528 RepID=UPI001E475D83|nr:hypothetical protein [Sphingomonas sp. IC-11]MCD2317491.1 hypothetical protein [Sphingomonas sp. IC-11]